MKAAAAAADVADARGVRVALDGRGAERGPEAIAEGAAAAAGDRIALRVFGDPGELRALEGVAGVEVVAAPDHISNEDEPVRAVRSRPQASVVMAADDVAKGGSDALVSAGATGAAMTAALFALRRLRGVRRPALAVQLPNPSGSGSGAPTLLLDVGANSEVRAGDLVQFAYLGGAFSEAVLGVTRPRVALLSVGEEAGKGTNEVVEAHAALVDGGGAQEMGLIRFVGNVEGRDLLSGAADVIVTDGFTGNVVLKTIEGTAKTVASAIREAARSNPIAATGGLLLRPALGDLRRRTDPDTTGGAILLGLRGVAVVAHGSSGPDGIANAVRLAAAGVTQNATERTAALLERSGVIGRGRGGP